MSFYFDDEPSQADNDESEFLCVTCGGSDYYLDPIGGALCCTSCFTQSQQMTQESTELDMEEVQALAARTSSGRVMANGARRRGVSDYVPQSKKPLEEYDTSQPFPNLITCLHGIQQVMKHCIGPLCDLVGLSKEEDSVEETVKSLWMSYLKAWTDGAEFYGSLHPEVRFSLRDCFLPTSYHMKVIKHLSHKAAEIVRMELDTVDEEKKEESLAADDSEEPSDEEEERDPHVGAGLTKRHAESIQYFQASYHNPKSLMNMYWHTGKRGRMECALLISPSMKFVACLLWLAVSRAGVTLNHVLQWIANGALPLQNAFKHCLSKQEQQALIQVASFFRMTTLPPLDQMESLVDRMVVACGLKSFSHLHGIPTAPSTSSAAKVPPETVSSDDKGKSVSEIRERPDFSYVTPRSVPLLTARLIQDLGFGQVVLYRSLALMSILKQAPLNLWLPAPLQGALPKNLGTTAQVLAVIAVACRMTPGWETWVYPGPSPASTGGPEGKERWNEDRPAKRQRNEAKSNRFVPYNEEQFQLLRNGPLVDGYLNFLEENVVDDREAIFPKFCATLESTDDDEAPKRLSADDENAVQKRPVLKQSCDPFHGSKRIWRRQKAHDWKLRIKRKRARWADANGLGEYVIYEDPFTHAADRKRSGTSKLPVPEPFHPQYGLLIEYMSYKTNVKSSKIHAAVTVLDDEILRIVRPKEETKRKYTRKAPIQDTSKEADLVASATMNVGEDESQLFYSEEAAVDSGDQQDDSDVLIISSATNMVEV